MPTFARMLFVVLLADFSTVARAENWPQFRAPRRGFAAGKPAAGK